MTDLIKSNDLTANTAAAEHMDLSHVINDSACNHKCASAEPRAAVPSAVESRTAESRTAVASAAESCTAEPSAAEPSAVEPSKNLRALNHMGRAGKVRTEILHDLLSLYGRMKARLSSLLGAGATAAMLAFGLNSCTPAHAALAVIDASALSESITQRVISIEQWARDNINQARQIEELLSGNTIATDTQNLMDRNYAMDSKQSWENIARIKEQSLSMLYASRSAWEEFGSAQQYLASFQKASAWSRCMQSGSCSFSRVLTELEDSTISQAMEAFEMSQSMNLKLQEQIDEVQALVVESQSSASQAGTLDALSKINGSAALSMIDLNNQIALLTRLQSHDLARESNSRLAREGYLKEITRHVPKDADRIPLESFMQHRRQ